MFRKNGKKIIRGKTNRDIQAKQSNQLKVIEKDQAIYK